MFPIFPVDYPFIRKGHSFTMDSNRRARTKARQPGRCRGANISARLAAFAVPDGLFLVLAGVQTILPNNHPGLRRGVRPRVSTARHTTSD